MRVNRLDLNQLACLDALLTERNVSRAAERVSLSQPALSATLARMREFFHDPLLMPVGRAMHLTPFAKSLIEPVRDLLLQVQALTERRPEADASRVQRTVTVVCSDYAFTMLLAPVLARAQQEAPRLRFEIRSIAAYLTAELDRGDVDLVILPVNGITSTHPSQVLLKDRFSCIVWTGNELVGKRLTREAFLECGHVATAMGRERAPTMDQVVMDDQKLGRRIEIRVPAFTMVPSCIVGTNRVATLQHTLAVDLAARYDLRVLACPVPIPEIVTAVQWHRHQSQDPAISWVREALRQRASTLMAHDKARGRRKATAGAHAVK